MMSVGAAVLAAAPSWGNCPTQSNVPIHGSIDYLRPYAMPNDIIKRNKLLSIFFIPIRKIELRKAKGTRFMLVDALMPTRARVE